MPDAPHPPPTLAGQPRVATRDGSARRIDQQADENVHGPSTEPIVLSGIGPGQGRRETVGGRPPWIWRQVPRALRPGGGGASCSATAPVYIEGTVVGARSAHGSFAEGRGRR